VQVQVCQIMLLVSWWSQPLNITENWTYENVEDVSCLWGRTNCRHVLGVQQILCDLETTFRLLFVFYKEQWTAVMSSCTFELADSYKIWYERQLHRLGISWKTDSCSCSYFIAPSDTGSCNFVRRQISVIWDFLGPVLCVMYHTCGCRAESVSPLRAKVRNWRPIAYGV
jgi:hypothetical protein